MIDEVKNPWNMKKGVIVVDIETNWADDWTEQGKRDRIFKCGVAFNYDDGKYHKFRDPKKLVKILNDAKAIVTYNGEGFDFLVLEKYGLKIKKYKDRWKPIGIKSLDIMHTIMEKRPKEHRNKKYPSLNEMIHQHYGLNKTEYNSDVLEEVMEHCLKDVEYTKMLYEEKIWKVPVIERTSKKRRWDNWYDDDVSGVVWDGENWTYIADFGRPVGQPNAFHFIQGNIPRELDCPLCEKGKISLYNVVAKCRTDEETCPNCGGLIKFAPGTSTIISATTKEEVSKNICPNCGKRLEQSGYEHYGYGAGHGFLSHGRSICPACGKGCYEWEDDDTPGFREHWKGKCCYCGKDIDKWYIEQHNEKVKKRINK